MDTNNQKALIAAMKDVLESIETNIDAIGDKIGDYQILDESYGRLLQANGALNTFLDELVKADTV
jgi:hypothetical protein